MAATVISVTQLPKQTWEYGTSGEAQAFTNHYVVVLNNPVPMDPYAARVVLAGGVALGLPYANMYDSVSGFYAYKIKAENESGDETGTNWHVTAEFRSMPWVGASGNPPWQYYDVVERTVVKYPAPMTKDFSSPPNPIQNSAFDPPSEPLTHDLINPKFRLHRHRRYSDFNYNAATAAQMTTNTTGFTIVEIGGVVTSVGANCALLHSIVAHPETWVDGTLYQVIVAEIELKGQYPPGLPDLTKVRLQNRGMRILQTANTPSSKVHATTTIDDPNNPGTPMVYPVGYPIASLVGKKVLMPVSHPVFLKLDGTQWPQDGTDPTAADLVFTRFPSTDWSSFII